jgi:hypothetical protein
MKRILGLLFIICIEITGGEWLSAQDSIYSNMKIRAGQFLDNRNYDSALPIYRDLLHRFPKEPEYLYGAAISLTMLNRDPEEALTMLRSVNSSGYNPLSWYYTGLLEHHNYLFDDAIKAYSKFTLLGKSADVKTLDVTRLIEMARNGLEFTHNTLNLKVLDAKPIHPGQIEKVAEINGTGKLVKKPVEFCSKSDIREEYRPMMYLPVYTEMNDYVYVSGYDKQRKGLKQIYRVRNINHETWGIPEILDKVINTPYDEEYPYFDARNSTLYFSSKGHSSMGGYDIFKSVYDWNTKSWSKPENLGFPINSPFDDYFYISDEFAVTASFVSNREMEDGQAFLYKIRQSQDTANVMMTTIEEIQKASRLKEKADKMPASVQATGMAGISSAITEAAASEPSPVITRNDYNKILSDALNLQLRSDSLARIVRDKRVVAKETPDDEMKKQLISDIIRMDKESKRLQREADLKFAEAKKLNEENRIISAPDTIMPAINSANELTSAEQPAPQSKKNEFTMMEKSPYGSSNPIPKGLETYSGLIYRIQLGAFTKARPSEAFGGISPVSFEQMENSSVLKYYAGVFYSLNSVTFAISQVKKNGFPDAFIVAYLDGKLISTEKAKEIEFAGMKF